MGISDLPDNIRNEDLEEKLLTTFGKLGVTVDSSNVDDCQWLPIKVSKKFINKLFKCKEANKIRRIEKKLKRMNLYSLWIATPVYINDSLYSYYKNVIKCRKCQKVWSSKFIHPFWVSNKSIKLKTADNRRVHVITQKNELGELFPGNELLIDAIDLKILYFLLLYFFI